MTELSNVSSDELKSMVTIPGLSFVRDSQRQKCITGCSIRHANFFDLCNVSRGVNVAGYHSGGYGHTFLVMHFIA